MKIWWCQEHDTFGRLEACWWSGTWEPKPCRMVPMRLIPDNEETVELIAKVIYDGNLPTPTFDKQGRVIPFLTSMQSEMFRSIAAEVLAAFDGGDAMKPGTVAKVVEMMEVKQVWWVERDNGDRVAGPFTTRDDAWRARGWVERALKPETFWLRSHPVGETP